MSGTLRCRLASALIMLASTANPSPTNPTAMRRRTAGSNTLVADRAKVAFLNRLAWPYGFDQSVLRDEFARPLDQRPQQGYRRLA
jgi:hypothetical protein